VISDELMRAQENADAERCLEIANREKIYKGEHPPSLEVDEDGVDDNVILNNAGTIVDVGVDFLFGKGITFTVEDNPTAEEFLEQVWKNNRRDTLLRELGTNGAIAGHSFLKIVPDPKGTDHQIVVLDPSTVSVFFDQDNYKRVLGYRVQYNAVDDHGRAVARREDTMRQENGTWLVTLKESRQVLVDDGFKSIFTTTKWEPVSETPWPFQWAPIVDCQNLIAANEYYGVSDIEAALVHINMVVNRVASNTAKTLRHFAHPIPVGRGFTAAEFQSAIGAMLVLPYPDADIKNLEMQSDLAGSHSFFHLVDEKFFELARVPTIAIGKLDGVGDLSGVALEIVYRPLLAKTETKRHLYGDCLVAFSQRLLELAGFGTVVVAIVWPEVLPKNLKELSEVAANLMSVGVSKRTIFEKLGINADEEFKRIAEEAMDPMGDTHGLQQRLDELEAENQRLLGRAAPGVLDE
jgi:hypothetical protein